jgi:hypothetical protein
MAEKNSNTAPATKEAPYICAVQHSNDVRPKRRMAAKIRAVPPTPNDVVTADEARLIAAYRGADYFTQRIYLRGLERGAEDNQLKRHAVPRLRIV